MEPPKGNNGLELTNDGEVWQVIKDGGIRLCDYALTKWISGDYCRPRPWPDEDEQMRQENIARWKWIKGRIPELVKGAKHVDSN